MKKEETIRRYGEEAYKKILKQRRAYHKEHKEADNARSKKYQEDHPEEVKAAAKKCREKHPEEKKARSQEKGRKGGKYYEQTLEYNHTGLRGERGRIRMKHAHQYKPYKAIIAPESQLHHEWVPQTDEYRGVALVEKEQHQYGIVDVIQILDGKINLLTEDEVKRGKPNKK